MCLYTRNKVAKVATKDIECIKYLNKRGDSYITPCQNYPVKLNEEIKAGGALDARDYMQDDWGNQIYSINGGAIHARLTSNSVTDYSFKAIIPKGTEYWVDTFYNEICAKKMFITSEKCNKVDLTDLFMEEHKNAPMLNGIKVGDFYMKDGTVVSPTDAKKEDIIGQVIGFHNGKPLIADINYYNDKAWDSKWQSCNIDGYFDSRESARNDFDGLKHTKAYMKQRDSRFEAFKTCVNKGKEWYLPSLGEMTTILNNINYINAARLMVGLDIIDNSGWYWSSSQGDSDGSWGCRLDCSRVGYSRYDSCRHSRVIPFVSIEVTKKINKEINNNNPESKVDFITKLINLCKSKSNI